MGAKACGVIPIDTVHIRVHDLEDLERNLILSKKLGFEGMLILNPKELPLCHRYYSPGEDEVAWPRRCSRWPKKPNAKVKGWPSRTISSSGRRWSKWRKPFLTNTV